MENKKRGNVEVKSRVMKKFMTVAIATMCLFVAGGCAKTGGGQDGGKTSSSGAEQVKKYIISSSRVTVLTNKENVYYVGKGLSYQDEKDANKPTKFLEDIKDLVDSGNTWIDKNNDLYIVGIDGIKGGVLKKT